jgi:Ca2+-binding RTX toxin-like protein
LIGDGDSEVIIGFAGDDLVLAKNGHDCAVGGPGDDRIDGGGGMDRLTGGPGRDVLVDREDGNAFDAGPGRDSVYARNGARELVQCGPGKDRAQIDRNDRARGCELVTYQGRVPQLA